MCGRFTLVAKANEIRQQFLIKDFHESIPLLPNISPMQPILSVVRNSTTKQNEPRFMQWGLVPSWSKDPKSGAKLINARSETIAEKPSFRGAFRHHRCLIPAEGFYEWEHIEGSKKKSPVWFGRPDHRLIAFAGLWETWTAPDGSELDSCTIITTTANSVVAELHERMPVILPESAYDIWLDSNTPSPVLQSLLTPYPAEELTLSRELAEERLGQKPTVSQRTLFEDHD